MFLESLVSIFSHQMVDFMCSFGFGVLCFALHLFSPRIRVLHVWVIGWDYSMFLCPSSPWLCHQSLLHPVVGRSAAGNMPVGGLKPHVLGELDLGICFNLSIFEHL